jgi:hypothetical protein
MAWSPNPPMHAFETLPLVGSQWLMWTFMKVHSLIDHRVAKTTLQQPGAWRDPRDS